jgi:hypothetical protein
MIQIGFLFQLNYNFVIENQQSAKQIFEFLPAGLAYGLGISEDQVVMQALRPYDTIGQLGYVTTLAMAYVPSECVNALSLDIHTPPSPLYNNPNVSVNTLVNIINPAISILAGGDLNGTPIGTGTGSPTSTVSAIVSEGAPLGGGTDNSSSIKGTSVGIGVGVCVGAAVYGAAMFFVAQRYKKRRQQHRRSASYIDTSSMARSEMATGAGAPLFSGGLRTQSGNGDYDTSGYGYYSGRNSGGSGGSGGSAGRQQISAPVMAENSLGWN